MPTMWCLMIDELIRLLNEAGFFIQVYAEDILLLVEADDEHVLAGLTQHTLAIVQACCELVRPYVNLDKVNIMLFVTRYEAEPIVGCNWAKSL